MEILDFLWSVLSGGETESVDSEDWDPKKEGSPKRTHEGASLIVTGTMKVSGLGTVVTARITDGVLETEDVIEFENGMTAEVETIELHHNEVERAEEGNVVGLELGGIDSSHVPEGSEAKTKGGLVDE